MGIWNQLDCLKAITVIQLSEIWIPWICHAVFFQCSWDHAWPADIRDGLCQSQWNTIAFYSAAAHAIYIHAFNCSGASLRGSPPTALQYFRVFIPVFYLVQHMSGPPAVRLRGHGVWHLLRGSGIKKHLFAGMVQPTLMNAPQWVYE